MPGERVEKPKGSSFKKAERQLLNRGFKPMNKIGSMGGNVVGAMYKNSSGQKAQITHNTVKNTAKIKVFKKSANV